MRSSTCAMRRLPVACAALALIVPSIFADGSSGSGSVSLATNGLAVTQDFNTLALTGASSTLPAGWYVTEAGTGAAANGSYTAGTGSSNSGDSYSFGAASATERALGSVASGSVVAIHYGAKFVNDTGGVITALTVSYAGEQWRRGTSTTDGLTFSYSLNATGLTAGTFTPIAALNFASPIAGCSTVTNVATNGNTDACRTSLSATISGLSLAPGSFIWLRWSDVDSSGSDDGVAIDDVSVTPAVSSLARRPQRPAQLLPATVNPGAQPRSVGTIGPGFNPLSSTLSVSVTAAR